jgi:hypothetical protein
MEKKTFKLVFQPPRIMRIGRVVLRNGVNEISEDAWATICTNPFVIKDFEKGDLFFIKNHAPSNFSYEKKYEEFEPADLSKKVEDKKPEPIVEDDKVSEKVDSEEKQELTEEESQLIKLNATEAKKLVESTFDKDILLKWQCVEERAGVLKTIKAQLDALQ